MKPSPDIILTNGIAFQIYSEDLTMTSREARDWETSASPIFSEDLESVISIGLAEDSLQLLRRRVSTSDREHQVSIVLTKGLLQPSRLVAWDEPSSTM